MTIFPIAFAIVLSFEKVGVTANGFQLQGATLSNYHTVVTAGLWHHALWFTTYYTVISVIIEVVLGTLFALVLERLTHFRGPMMAILLIPWSLITVISAELWGYIYDATYGILDDLSHIFGTGEPSPGNAFSGDSFVDFRRRVEDNAVCGHHRAGPELVMIPKSCTRPQRSMAPGVGRRSEDSAPAVAADARHRRVVRGFLQAFGIFDLPYVLTGRWAGQRHQLPGHPRYNTLFLDRLGARGRRGHDHGADHLADVHNFLEGVQGPAVGQGGSRCGTYPPWLAPRLYQRTSASARF